MQRRRQNLRPRGTRANFRGAPRYGERGSMTSSPLKMFKCSDKFSNVLIRWSIRMIRAKNYETVFKFVKVMPRKLMASFSLDTVYLLTVFSCGRVYVQFAETAIRRTILSIGLLLSVYGVLLLRTLYTQTSHRAYSRDTGLLWVHWDAIGSGTLTSRICRNGCQCAFDPPKMDSSILFCKTNYK